MSQRYEGSACRGCGETKRLEVVPVKRPNHQGLCAVSCRTCGCRGTVEVDAKRAGEGWERVMAMSPRAETARPATVTASPLAIYGVPTAVPDDHGASGPPAPRYLGTPARTLGADQPEAPSYQPNDPGYREPPDRHEAVRDAKTRALGNDP